MGEIEDKQEVKIMVKDEAEDLTMGQFEPSQTTNPPSPPRHQPLGWWLQISIFIVFVVLGQAIVALLGRLYYEKGGKSNWLMTLLQLVGFPFLLPLYYFLPHQNHPQTNITPPNYPLKVTSVYIFLGLFSTGLNLLYSMALQYMPVSTFTLIISSQLAFNALFSFLLISQKFTPYIINSVILLTISSTLLVFNSDSSLPSGVSKSKYHLGFVFAVGNAVACGLFFPLTQLAMKRVVKREAIKNILDMVVYESMAASVASLVGLFASGEWKTLSDEINGFKSGKVSYFMIVIWIALTDQLFYIGLFGLIVKVSPLFSNVVSTFGLPVAQVLAVIFFHDSMSGIKVIAVLLAIWGLVSYAYQQYLDHHHEAKTRKQTTGLSSDAVEEIARL